MAISDQRISKTLSLWLRHKPELANVALDQAGWADVTSVLTALAANDLECDWERLLLVVEGSDKQRFELSADAARIRARQGHSIVVALDWPRADPPGQLYHGTVERFLPSILSQGLLPMRRHHVHLSPDIDTARRVGARRGEPVVLIVDAFRLAATGHDFFLTSNNVWLTARVPPEYLRHQHVPFDTTPARPAL